MDDVLVEKVTTRFMQVGIVGSFLTGILAQHTPASWMPLLKLLGWITFVMTVFFVVVRLLLWITAIAKKKAFV